MTDTALLAIPAPLPAAPGEGGSAAETPGAQRRHRDGSGATDGDQGVTAGGNGSRKSDKDLRSRIKSEVAGDVERGGGDRGEPAACQPDDCGEPVIQQTEIYNEIRLDEHR